MEGQASPGDVSDEEGSFVAPYLTLMIEEAPQRSRYRREVFDGLCWIARAGAPWRMMPSDLPPWGVVSQQTQRWRRAHVFEAMVHELRVLLRLADGRTGLPSAVILDSRTRPSVPKSGPRAGDDEATRKWGSEVYRAVEALGHLLALHVTAAYAQDRVQLRQLTEWAQEVTGDAVEVACVDRGYAGDQPAPAARQQHKTILGLGQLHHFALDAMGRRLVVERSFAWAARFRRLARDYKRLPATLVGFHVLVFAILMLTRCVALWSKVHNRHYAYRNVSAHVTVSNQ